jgi:hypothetical protein
MSDFTKTTFHRDATVTFWDVSAQQWVRTSNPTDAQLASMSSTLRKRVIRHVGG